MDSKVIRQNWKDAFATADAPKVEDLWDGVPVDEAWDERPFNLRSGDDSENVRVKAKLDAG